jgi:hypothetical protein
MELLYHITGTARKEFARLVGEILGCEVVYLGTPSFAFAIGEYIVDRNGNLQCPSAGSEELFKLISELKARYFVADNAPKPPIMEDKAGKQAELAVLVVELPGSGFSLEDTVNIGKIIQSKATLIRNVIGKNLIAAAEHLPVEATGEKLRFSWFEPNISTDELNAYIQLLAKICEMAQRQKYVIAQERVVENQKYAFRCFLLRLGFIGPQYGTVRKILLATLAGNGSPKSGSPPSRNVEVAATGPASAGTRMKSTSAGNLR